MVSGHSAVPFGERWNCILVELNEILLKKVMRIKIGFGSLRLKWSALFEVQINVRLFRRVTAATSPTPS
jgi:hypothetical protein